MKFILGKKLSMTQIWRNDLVVPVTRIQVEPCVITQIKTVANDGYRAVQLGTGQRSVKNIAKPQQGHFGQWGNFQYLREFNLSKEASQPEQDWQPGQVVSLASFQPGDRVAVTAISKGKGFQGVVKRYGFKGQGRSHGVKDQHRMPGSIGAAGVARVFKGMKMGGRMGGEQVTVTNLEVVEVDLENGYLYLRGAVPGWRNGLVSIVGLGQVIIETKDTPVVEEKIIEKESVIEKETIVEKELVAKEDKAEDLTKKESTPDIEESPLEEQSVVKEESAKAEQAEVAKEEKKDQLVKEETTKSTDSETDQSTKA